MTVLKKSLYNLIRKEESFFNFIQDFSLYGYWFIDLEKTSDIFIDQKLLKSLDFDPDIMKNELLSPNSILDKKEYERVIFSVKNQFTKFSDPVNLEISYTSKSGSSINFNSKAIALINSDSKVTAILVGNTSLANEPESIQDSQQKAKRLERIIESTNIGTWEWNVQTGEAIFNEKWANILGYSLAELQPTNMKTWEKFAHPEDHERSNRLLEEHFLGKTEYYVIESRFKNKEGEWIWVKDTGKVGSWTKDGKPEWMTGSHQDITERKKHALLLEKYQDLLERSNKAAMIGTWEVDLIKSEAHWSEVTKEIHEVAQDFTPILEEAINFYPKGIHRDTVENSVKAALENGENYDIEVEIITGNGNRKWVRAIGISEFKNGKCERLYGLFQDIHIRKEANRLNNEKQTLLETILNSIEVGIVSCDREGNLTLFNNATKKWHGLPAEPIPVSEFSNHYGLFHLDGKSPLKTEDIPLIQALYTGDVTTKEFIISPNNGEIKHIVAAGSQLVGEDGNVFGAVVTMHDITKIKKTTQQLKISEAAFRGNFENAVIGMAILNEKTEWLEVNDQLSKIVGYTREELLSLTVFDITHKDDISTNIALLKEFLSGKKSYLNNEQRFIHKNGSIVHTILSVSVVKNDQGNPLYFIGQITDITPRKIAAQKLQETLAKLEGILDSSTHVSIIGTDTDGNITTFNRGAENLLGYSKDEMIGKESPAKIHLKSEIQKRGEELSADSNKKIENFDVFRTLAISDDYDTREWTYVRKDGVQFPVQLTVTPVKDKDNIIGYLGVAAEITEIKRVENEIKSLLVVTSDQNDRLKNFAHIVSHNLRSHSGNFAMLLSLFLQDFPEAEDNEIMTMLKLASENLKETIAHLNEVVLINTNIDDSLISINLYNTTVQSIRNVAGIANDAEVEIINNIDPKHEVQGLQAYLDSIILNFLTNGIKYRSLERASFVKIDSKIEENFVLVSISDNGLGIDLKKHKSKIFGMYKTFHKNKESRGIGLFITKNQIESLGGRIEVESEVDKGTTFKLYLKHEKN